MRPGCGGCCTAVARIAGLSLVLPALAVLAAVHCALLLPSLTAHDWNRLQRRRRRLAAREADPAATGTASVAQVQVGSLRVLPPAPRCSLLRSACLVLRLLLLSALRLLLCYIAPALLLLVGSLPRRALGRGLGDGVSMVVHALPLLGEQVWQAAATAAASSASRGSAAAAGASSGAGCGRRQSRWSWKAFRVALGLSDSPCSSSLAPASLMQRWLTAARECERSWEQEAQQRLLLAAAASASSSCSSSSLTAPDDSSSNGSSSSSLLLSVGAITKVDEGDETQSDDEEDRAGAAIDADADATLEGVGIDQDTPPCCFELPPGCVEQPTPSLLRCCPVTFPAAVSSSRTHDGATPTADQCSNADLARACTEFEQRIVRPAMAAVASAAAAAAAGPSSSSSPSPVPLPFEFFFSAQVGVNCSSDDCGASNSSGSDDPSHPSAPCSSSAPSSSSSFESWSTFDQPAVEAILRGARLRRVQSYECEGALVSVHFGFELPAAADSACSMSPLDSASCACSRSVPVSAPPPLLHWSPPLPSLDPADRRVLDFSIWELAANETIQIAELHRVAATQGIALSLYTDAGRRFDLCVRRLGVATAALSSSPSCSSLLGLLSAPSGSCVLGVRGLLALPSLWSCVGVAPRSPLLCQVQLVFGRRLEVDPRKSKGGDTALEQRLTQQRPMQQPQPPPSAHAPLICAAADAGLFDCVFAVGCIPLSHLAKQQQAVEFITATEASSRTSPSPAPMDTTVDGASSS